LRLGSAIPNCGTGRVVVLGVFFGLLIPLFAAKLTFSKHIATASSASSASSGSAAVFRC